MNPFKDGNGLTVKTKIESFFRCISLIMPQPFASDDKPREAYRIPLRIDAASLDYIFDHPAFTAHADFDVCRLENKSEIPTCKLRALICIEILWICLYFFFRNSSSMFCFPIFLYNSSVSFFQLLNFRIFLL